MLLFEFITFHLISTTVYPESSYGHPLIIHIILQIKGIMQKIGHK